MPVNRRRVRARLARALVVAAVAVGGLVVGLAVAHMLRPGEGEVFQAATGLVPPGAELVDIGEIGGESFMDAPFHVRVVIVAEAQDHMPVVAAVEANAAERGWSLTGQFLCLLRSRDASVKMVPSEPVTPSPSWS